MKDKTLKKILVIGSGPIIIGQAAEFDYSGTQACLALKEEGYQVILINPNPATIMTDKTVVEKVYMEPLTIPFIKWVISKERPDALLPTLGGQMGLNIAVQLFKKGILDQYNVKIIGTNIHSIEAAEDRDLFRTHMLELKIPIPKSKVIKTLAEAEEFVAKIGFPFVIRPSYTLGGTGSNIIWEKKDLVRSIQIGLDTSPVHECLIEESIFGWKEIEFEVVRDAADKAIIICGMENVDPVGVHTGDSMVVAPCQSLTPTQYTMLAKQAINIVRHFKIEGGCNIQFGLHPTSDKYCVIEINPRVSRSSAIASKASAYPIAKITTKIACGMTLDEIIINKAKNLVKASVEPIFSYVVFKMPQFPFDKYVSKDYRIFTQMQATGEVMAFGKTFEEAFLKSLRGLNLKEKYMLHPRYEHKTKAELLKLVASPNGFWIYQIYLLLKLGVSCKELADLTKIAPWFFDKWKNIVDAENLVRANVNDVTALKAAKKMGFSDALIATWWKTTTKDIFQLRKAQQLMPVYKNVDTYPAEFATASAYLYSTYADQKNESVVTKTKKVIIVGSGPIKIGQGVEFDFATTHGIWTLKKFGYQTIVVNNNPETVSTDFTVSDKLYFEPLEYEDIRNIVELEQPDAVILQFGGQTALNLTQELAGDNIKILGTQLESIDICENRELFAKALTKWDIPHPKGYMANNVDEAVKLASKLGFPLIVRPSYVIGGQSMRIFCALKELKEHLTELDAKFTIKQIWIDKYIDGIELEFDAVCDGKKIITYGIMEHVEHTGIHGGDSTAIFPTMRVSAENKKTIIKIITTICTNLKIIGLINFQLILANNKVYVLEANPRSSRTIPFLMKALGVNFVSLATEIMLNPNQHHAIINPDEVLKKQDIQKFYVKSPVFSFAKLAPLVNPFLGPEMQSTGEVLGADSTFNKALYKALLASNIDVLKQHKCVLSVANVPQLRQRLLAMAKILHNLDYVIYATPGTHQFFVKHNIPSQLIEPLSESKAILNLIKDREISFIINVPTLSQNHIDDYYEMRLAAMLANIAVISSMDLAERIVELCGQMKYLIKAL